ILSHAKGLHGFYGASSMERLPAEAAIARQTADFKAVTLGDDRAPAKKKKG
ncbi:phosphoenolpyruvate hydrolase family protein, partial [Mesorhizobium sp. M00.F.Ca.ET.158.01.1.1]